MNDEVNNNVSSGEDSVRIPRLRERCRLRLLNRACGLTKPAALRQVVDPGGDIMVGYAM